MQTFLYEIFYSIILFDLSQKAEKRFFFLILFLFDSILSFELFDYINWNLIYMPKSSNFKTRNTFLDLFFFWQFSYDKCINHFNFFFIFYEKYKSWLSPCEVHDHIIMFMLNVFFFFLIVRVILLVWFYSCIRVNWWP